MDPVFAFNPGVYAAAIQASQDAKDLRNEVAKLREEQAAAAVRAEERRVMDLWVRQYEFEGMAPVDAEAAARKKVIELKREAKRRAADSERAYREAEDSTRRREQSKRDKRRQLREEYLETVPWWKRPFAGWSAKNVEGQVPDAVRNVTAQPVEEGILVRWEEPDRLMGRKLHYEVWFGVDENAMSRLGVYAGTSAVIGRPRPGPTTESSGCATVTAGSFSPSAGKER